MTGNLAQLWNPIAQLIQEKVSEDTYQRWFSGMALVSANETDLVLEVGNEIHQVWIEENYMPVLNDAVARSLEGSRRLMLTVKGMANDAAESTSFSNANTAKGKSKAADQKPRKPHATLNPAYRFTNFVVGTNNQFAHAASSAVAEAPSLRYNPLFIHGASGLGKTHLMQAIGNEILQSRPNANVVYLTSETFANEFIDSIQKGQLTAFRAKYRKAEVLLIDDVQFLGGKDRSQEEFFHTFNSLFDGQKHVVITSDRPACEISKLEPRLVSRFECGLTVELSPPSMETRIAILHQKRDEWGVKIEENIIRFLAERITRNVRRLEGALMRIASYASLSGEAVSLEKAEGLLKDILREEASKQVTIDAIQRKVAEHFDIRLADMTSRRRPENIAFPRQVAMYLSRTMTRSSLVDIGEAFGGRDHGTVIHAHKKVIQKMGDDENLRQVVEMLTASLR